MDNLIVGLTGAVCFVAAETSTNWIDSLTPLGIVALVVYYFLWKFDRKLDVIEERTKEIKDDVDDLKKEVKRDEQNS